MNAPYVLVVDDEDLNYMVVEGLLEDFTENVAWAADGLEAIEFITHHQVDVVLMDAHMPEMTGDIATQKMLAIKPELKVIAMTADATYKERMLAAGCVDFLLKPINMRSTVDAITRALAWRAAA